MMTLVQKIFLTNEFQDHIKILIFYLKNKYLTFQAWGISNSINPNFNSAILPFQEKYVTLFFNHILLKDKSNTGQTKQYVLAQNQDKPKTRPVLAPEFQT